MKMSKFLIAIALICSFSVSADPVSKVNLRIKALIIDRSCSVDPNSTDIRLDLGNWASKQFQRSGDKTKAIPFSIYLKECNYDTVKIAFRGVADSFDSRYLSIDRSSTATNVAIEILDKEKKLLPLTVYSPLQKPSVEGTSRFDFFANYIVTSGAVTAGTANSVATFELNYD